MNAVPAACFGDRAKALSPSTLYHPPALLSAKEPDAGLARLEGAKEAFSCRLLCEALRGSVLPVPPQQKASPPARFLTGRAQLHLSHPPPSTAVYAHASGSFICILKLLASKGGLRRVSPRLTSIVRVFKPTRAKRLAVVCIRNKQKGTSRRRGVLCGGWGWGEKKAEKPSG